MDAEDRRKAGGPAMETVAGTPVSRGFAAGPVFVHRPDEVRDVPEYEIPPERVEAEVERYLEARQKTRDEVEALAVQLSGRGGNASAVFSNHATILDDESIRDQIIDSIRAKRMNAEAAIRRAVDAMRGAFLKMKDAYLRERVRDVEDIERRILGILLGKTGSAFEQIAEPVIVVAADLTPSDTVALPRDLVLGFATDGGSSTSHAALLARVMGIPAVVGLGDIVSKVKPGDNILLDGTNGTVTVNPDVATCGDFARLVKREREFMSSFSAEAGGEGAKGLAVRLCANAQPGLPLETFASYGAQGIGLYRTEYLWLGGRREPTEEEQTETYREAAKAAAGMGPGARVVFRALDIGGDKLMPDAPNREANPFLGQRSIRWLFAHRDVLRGQIRAILRASAEGPSAIMWPMIATVKELREANAELRRAKEQLRREGVAFDEAIPAGCMIEIPSAALCADALAKEVSFFSIGTNDLIQYTLAADRGNASVSYLYQPTNPAVLRLVAMAAKAAKSAGIGVAVCGETASDPVLGALWAGMGVDELSMSASYIPVMGRILSAVAREDLEEMAAEALEACGGCTAQEIYGKCRAHLLRKAPKLEEMQSIFTGAV